jgi:hypothetical protein
MKPWRPKPALINGQGGTSQFWYTPERRRWKQVAQSSAGTETTIYVGGQLEKVTRPSGTEYRHYLAAGSVQVVVTRSSSGQAIRYLPSDHLGRLDASVRIDDHTRLVRRENCRSVTHRGSYTSRQSIFDNRRRDMRIPAMPATDSGSSRTPFRASRTGVTRLMNYG